MDTTCRGNVGVQMDGDGNMSFPSLIAMPSAASVEALMISKASVAAHPFFSAGWDSLVQLGHHESMGSRIEPFGPNHLTAGNQVTRGSDSSPFPGQSGTDPGLAYFGSGNLSEAVVGSLSMPEFIGISDSGCLPSFGSYVNDAGGRGEGVRTSECHDSDDDTGRKSTTNGRTRKRNPDSRSSYDPNEAEKKQKHEKDECPGVPKQITRQSKYDSTGEEAPKENYIHVRARRGQATNSHSLAERIRREKISERMKMLQELVPGCSKITGKAVMLDEIINYVQSLQHQVEFLSMKLSTLVPDLPLDAGNPLLMDMNSQNASTTTMGLSNPGVGSFQHLPRGMSKGALPISPGATQYLSLSQLPFESELHALYQMGFDSNSGDVLKPREHLKPEQ